MSARDRAPHSHPNDWPIPYDSNRTMSVATLRPPQASGTKIPEPLPIPHGSNDLIFVHTAVERRLTLAMVDCGSAVSTIQAELAHQLNFRSNYTTRAS